MITLVKIYKVILEQDEIKGAVAQQINAALGQPIRPKTLTAAIDHLVVAKLIAAERRCGMWDRVRVLAAPSEKQIAAMQPMVRARYVFANLQLVYSPNLTEALTTAQLQEGLATHFPYLNAALVMERLFRGKLMTRPPADPTP